MQKIPFSPLDPPIKDWPVLEFDPKLDGFDSWIETRFNEAGNLYSDPNFNLFKSVAFSVGDLKKIIDQVDCTHLALTHIAVPDTKGKQTSILVAYGVVDDTVLASASNFLFAGTSMDSSQITQLLTKNNIKWGTTVPGFKWDYINFPQSPVSAQKWLSGIFPDKLFLNSIQSLRNTRFLVSDFKLILQGAALLDNVLFFPGLFYCDTNVNGNKPGNYASLVACRLGADRNILPFETDTSGNAKFFYIATNAWRPNWPIGVAFKFLEYENELLRIKVKELEEAIAQLTGPNGDSRLSK